MAIGLILDGQAPPFEGRVAARMREALWFDSAGGLAGAGVDYFGPVGRKGRRPLAGFSKGDVAESTNVVWLDLDPPPDLPTDRGSLVAHAEKWLDLLRLWGLAPSVFLFSGRGCWAYWKLDRHVPQAEAEALMRRLYAQFRPGGAEHDVGRVARMPGSVNEKTGLRAFVMALDPDARWDPDEIGALLGHPGPGPADGRTDGAPAVNLDLHPSGPLPELPLPPDLARYLAARPTKRERAGRLDGSALEQAIVARLVNAGCSDGQIALFFDHHRLPRHEEEKPRRGYRWLAVGIAKARARVVPSSPSVSIGKGTYSAEEEGEGGYGEREAGWQGRRWAILRHMPEGLPKLELLAWVQGRYSLGRSQARRELDWLEREKGYIASVPAERDRRIKEVRRTEAGRRRLETWRGPGIPFEFLKGLEETGGHGAAEPPPAPEPVPAAEQTARRPAPKPPPSPAAEKRATDRAEERRRERSLINDVYRIHIRGGPWTYLQLLLPLDEWARVRLHEQLRVGIDDDGFAVHRSFISPRDPALGGPDAEDPIEARTLRDGGFEARDRRIGVAAELVRSAAGFELATRVEGGRTLPNVGLIVQADKNFYNPLRAYRKHQEEVIAARKRGKDKATSYEFMIAGEGVEISTGYVPDLDALLDELADEAEMRAVLESLPEGWPLVKRLPW